MKPKGWLSARPLCAAILVAISCQCVVAHGLLTPELMQGMIGELQAQQLRIAALTDPEAKAEALFLVGNRIRAITDLLNQDFAVHGQTDPLAMMFVEHLASMGVGLKAAGRDGRFQYDLDAFHKYLKLLPSGTHAAEARFFILDQAFRLRTVDITAPLGAEAQTAARRALPEYERYLRDFSRGSHAREVRFFLGVECYRLALHSGADSERRRMRDCAEEALNEVARRYSDSIEARAASTILDKLLQ